MMLFQEPGITELEDDQWLNSGPVSPGDGTYLIDFWMYSCRCCQNRVNTLQEIHQYHPVEVLGVHYPDFSFERQKKNVERAIERNGIDYPVVHDPDKKTWKNFGGDFGAQQVLVRDGEVVWKSRNSETASLEEIVSGEFDIESGELANISDHRVISGSYLGFSRCQGVNNGGNFHGAKDLSMPENRRRGGIYLEGSWRQTDEFLESRGGKMSVPFRASLAGLVAGDKGIRDVEVLIDGKTVPRSIAGEDLRVEEGRSYVRLKSPRFYSLIEGQCRSAELTLKPEKGLRMYEVVFERPEP